MTAVLAANVSAGVDAGVHVCALYSSQDERRQLLEAYFRNRPGERLIYVGAAGDLGDTAGIDVREADGVYLAGGSFDPEGVLTGFRGEIADSMAAGHRGLRVAADMTWAAEGAEPDTLMSYEAAATQLHKEGTAAGMCLYDRRRFAPERLAAVSAAHPFTSGMPQGTVPAAFTATQEADGVLRLQGEIDYFGAAHLVTLVRDLPDVGGDVVIDLSDVRFIDAAVVHALQDAAAQLGARRLVLRAPSRAVNRLMALLPVSGTRPLVVQGRA